MIRKLHRRFLWNAYLWACVFLLIVVLIVVGALTAYMDRSVASTLNDILTEGFTMIILGNESVDYFDTVVESWKAAGGDVVTAAVNEMYGNK